MYMHIHVHRFSSSLNAIQCTCTCTNVCCYMYHRLDTVSDSLHARESVESQLWQQLLRSAIGQQWYLGGRGWGAIGGEPGGSPPVEVHGQPLQLAVSGERRARFLPHFHLISQFISTSFPISFPPQFSASSHIFQNYFPIHFHLISSFVSHLISHNTSH